MKLMLACRALPKLLSQVQDNAPPLAIRARMRLHLMTCQARRKVDEQMRLVRKAMRNERARRHAAARPRCVRPGGHHNHKPPLDELLKALRNAPEWACAGPWGRHAASVRTGLSVVRT